jgi:hypothetical protein
VYFTNTGTASIQLPSQTVVTTTNNVKFLTTANALILPQSQSPNAVPVPILACNSGVSGNVPAGSITVIPPESLTNIAQAQTPEIKPESLKATLTVTNPEATTGGRSTSSPSMTQQGLDCLMSHLEFHKTFVHKFRDDSRCFTYLNIGAHKGNVQQSNYPTRIKTAPHAPQHVPQPPYAASAPYSTPPTAHQYQYDQNDQRPPLADRSDDAGSTTE